MKIKSVGIARIDMDKNGDEIVTLENEHGQLEHVMKKYVSKELLAKYEGEVYNRQRE